MKAIFALSFCFCGQILIAASPLEREWTQLREQRDKALAAATDPIQKRYQASLEQLLRRATQANDLDLAIKIREELGSQVPTTGATNAFVTDAAVVARTLVGPWTWETSAKDSWGIFTKGSVFHLNNVPAEVSIDGKGVVTLTRSDKTKATIQLHADLKSFTGKGFDGRRVKGEPRK